MTSCGRWAAHSATGSSHPGAKQHMFPPALTQPMLAVVGFVHSLGSITLQECLKNNTSGGLILLLSLRYAYSERTPIQVDYIPYLDSLAEQYRLTGPGPVDWSPTGHSHLVGARATSFQNQRPDPPPDRASQFACSEHDSLQVDYIPYLDSLAEQVGVRLNILWLLLKDPKLALQVLLGPCTPYQYVLQPFRTRVVPEPETRPSWREAGGPTLEPGLGLGLAGEAPGGHGSLPTGPGRAQPEMATWARLPVGSPPCRKVHEGAGAMWFGSSRGGGPRRPNPLDQNSGNRDMECHLAGGRSLSSVREVERYRLEIVGLTSTHSLGSGTQLLEIGWTLHYSGVAQGERQLVWACL
ncbi:hypothetical protein L3Q82_008033 [Scortum barcoo]|uniref:Uncharacterized protein n=1 Tax=Scortum barcoo TaxID=214431 RepID=A0ACB8WKI9_9TELE|nr:hypothetical protein L3Q82_008033 [Scortum barcoo]